MLFDFINILSKVQLAVTFNTIDDAKRQLVVLSVQKKLIN